VTCCALQHEWHGEPSEHGGGERPSRGTPGGAVRERGAEGERDDLAAQQGMGQESAGGRGRGRGTGGGEEEERGMRPFREDGMLAAAHERIRQRQEAQEKLQEVRVLQLQLLQLLLRSRRRLVAIDI